MNYRHAFHAGNFADVFKHVLLTRILVYLCRKDAPFRYIETHAGPGVTDLGAEAARRTGEWQDGIARVIGAPLAPELQELLGPYLSVAGPGAASKPMLYPGSPRIAQSLLRRQDRATLCELHPDDVRALERTIAGDPAIKILHEDGYRALRGLVPPLERRGLVLIDPPFESRDEFTAMEESLVLAHRKWETGIFALWYPVKEIRPVAQFVGRLKARGIPRILRLELTVEAVRTDAPLSSTGLIIVNPPYTLVQEARVLLPGLLALLRRGPGAEFFIEQVTGEAPINS
ncbi:MAG: rRNA ((2030)-N(6))-methyltransferase RlmJ [Hyphomicrobiales bacterium]|nr:rRNA ((2030)-N(6))-methyltransferase RlmJ [Hyphomicrobiales bacterium]